MYEAFYQICCKFCHTAIGHLVALDMKQEIINIARSLFLAQ